MRTTDGNGDPLRDGQLYYVQDTRTMVGNCISWWGPRTPSGGGSGYVCNLDEAGKYTAEDVKKLRETDVPYPVEYVDARVVRHVRGDNRDFARVSWTRQGSEKNCPNNAPRWFSGHWRDWHRGHGCHKDDGKARNQVAQQEIERHEGRTSRNG